MKQKAQILVSAAICMLLLLCLVQINSLKKEISGLRSNLSSQLSQIQNSVYGITGDIRSTLEEQSSLTASADWSYGEKDVEKGLVWIRCEVAAKEYTPGSTEAAIVCQEQEYPMRLENGLFVAEVPVDLYAETEISRVLFRDGGTVRTEKLEWYLTPRYECLLTVYSSNFGTSGGTPQDGALLWSRKGGVQITIDGKPATNAVSSVSVVAVLDGREIEREAVPLDERSDQEASGAVSALTEAAGETSALNSLQLLHNMDREYTIPAGSTLRIYAEVIDKDGILYRSQFEQVTADASGGMADPGSEFWNGAEAEIFDPKGNPKYTYSEEHGY